MFKGDINFLKANVMCPNIQNILAKFDAQLCLQRYAPASRKAYKNALEIYYKKDIDQDLLEKILTSNKKIIYDYEKDKEIREISHNLVKSIIHKCLRKFDK